MLSSNTSVHQYIIFSRYPDHNLKILIKDYVKDTTDY